jgi:hypothetical protein
MQTLEETEMNIHNENYKIIRAQLGNHSLQLEFHDKGPVRMKGAPWQLRLVQ